MVGHVFTGFGFGPIQGGLFAKEAFASGNFSRIVVTEIDAELVGAVKANNGSYYVNVARADGIEVLKIDNVELLDPNIRADRQILLEALAKSTEIVTCLPSVDFYESGGDDSVASLIAEAFKARTARATILYTAENNNHAAEILGKAVAHRPGPLCGDSVQFLNTVIGKMSRVVTDTDEIAELNLRTIAPGIDRAFLVEQFNRILVSRTQIPNFKPGIDIFIEKDDLMPFEEAKLYGHNAIHSLLGFVGAVRGYQKMTELANDPAVMHIGRASYSGEYGRALIRKYSHLNDELFTVSGFRKYTEDLLTRMTNPYLADTIARVVRDIPRKLEINGRIFGTMQLVLKHGLGPENMALGAMAGIAELLKKADENGLPEDLRFGDWRTLDTSRMKRIMTWLWSGRTSERADQFVKCVHKAKERLEELTTNQHE